MNPRSPDLTRRMQELAELAHRALGINRARMKEGSLGVSTKNGPSRHSN